ncbi:MAG TPA: hypothetical protein VIO60_07840, partial [Rectinemataceae bacterium]
MIKAPYRRRAMRGAFAALFALVALAAPFALSSDLVSADITLVLSTDGRADIWYKLFWKASGGMHGFYFQGEAFEPVWDMETCYADIAGGSRQTLDIKPMGDGRYDVVLAGGKSFSGQAYYTLHYVGDLTKAGLLGVTKSAERGELSYIDWASVEWDEPLESRTLRLVLPVRVKGPELDSEERASIPMLTDPSVNKDNRIDYYGSKGGDGNHYLTVRFFQEDIAARATQRLLLYFPVDFLGLQLPAASGRSSSAGSNLEDPLIAGSQSPANSLETETEGRSTELPLSIFLPAIAALIALALVLYSKRLRAYAASKAMIQGIAWAGDAWIPPKLFAGTYQVPGKVVEDLHPFQVALLLELPLPRAIGLMLEGLESAGLVDVESQDPLRIRILDARRSGEEMEEAFLACFDAEGRVLSGLLMDFVESAMKTLQERLWDCDIEATKAFYRAKLAEAEALEAGERVDEARLAAWRAA